MKRLSGGFGGSRCCISLTIYRLASSGTSLDLEAFRQIYCSEASHNCCRDCPGAGSMNFLFQTALCAHRLVLQLISTELRWRLNSANMLFSS